METKLITLKHTDKFSHIGLFSGATISTEDVAKIEGFKDKVKLVFVSYGSKEVGGGTQPRRGGDPEATVKSLKEAGVNGHYYLSPETAHEWQSWRRSLKEFAPHLFQSVNSDARTTSSKSDNSTKSITLEDGGQGPYKAIVTEDPSLEGMTIYRPQDLTTFGNENKLPILLWGNGACANSTEEHKNFLNEIASHGYIILGIGLFDTIQNRAPSARQRTKSSQLLSALEWINVENAREGSIYLGKIDTSKVAAMGMSCGGLQAIEISSDPRIKTTVVCNSGILPTPSTMPAMPALVKDDLKKLHGPVLYIMGGPSDIAYKNAMDDFARVDHIPIVMTSLDVGHGGTYRRPHGGEYSSVAIAWVDWQLKGKKDASKMFVGEDSDLKRDSKWTIETKKLDP